MKKIAYLFSSTAIIALAMLSSCKKDKEPTEDTAPEAPVVTATMTTTNEGIVAQSLDVTTSTGTAKIRLDVTSTVDLDKIYIMKSEDNGSSVAQSVSSITTSDGKTFTGGSSSYSLAVPGSTKSFIIDIPVSVRTTSAAVTDVYQIWITNGTGDFLIPSKKRVLGSAIVTLKYTAAATATFTTFSATVGDQNAVEPSFIVTSGQGGVIGQSSYKDATYPENAQSVDISFASLNSTQDGLGTYANLVSPSERINVGFLSTNEPSASDVNTTVFGSTSLTFSTVTAAELGTITGLTATKIDITGGGTFAFQTEAGKKGLINVGTISTSGTSGKKFTFTIKVLN